MIQNYLIKTRHILFYFMFYNMIGVKLYIITIYDLRPLEDGCIMYYGEDERISIFYNNRLIKFVGYQGEYNIGDSIKIVKVK